MFSWILERASTKGRWGGVMADCRAWVMRLFEEVGGGGVHSGD